jgi:hypothetical protein
MNVASTGSAFGLASWSRPRPLSAWVHAQSEPRFAPCRVPNRVALATSASAGVSRLPAGRPRRPASAGRTKRPGVVTASPASAGPVVRLIRRFVPTSVGPDSRTAVEPLDTNGSSSQPFGASTWLRSLGPEAFEANDPLGGLRARSSCASRRCFADHDPRAVRASHRMWCRVCLAERRSVVRPPSGAGRPGRRPPPSGVGRRGTATAGPTSVGSARAGGTRLRPEATLAETSRQQRTAYRPRSQPSTSVRRRRGERVEADGFGGWVRVIL